MPSRIGDRVVLKSNVVLNCQALTRVDGQAGLDCFRAVVQQEVADIIIYDSEDFLSRYENCLQRRPI
jgi:hypothetical protein